MAKGKTCLHNIPTEEPTLFLEKKDEKEE